jgi:hypothetical protein
MQGWTDDLTIPMPPNRTVAELVDFVMRLGCVDRSSTG